MSTGRGENYVHQYIGDMRRDGKGKTNLKSFFDVVLIRLVLEAQLAAIFKVQAKFFRKSFANRFERCCEFLF